MKTLTSLPSGMTCCQRRSLTTCLTPGYRCQRSAGHDASSRAGNRCRDAGDSCSLPSVNPHRPRIVAPDRSLLVTYAQGRRRPAEEDVDLDDEEYSDSDQGFGVSSVLRQAWVAVGSLTERLADVAYDYVPDSVARSTVVLAVRAAFVLLLVGFARSILGFVFTVGTVVLGLYVASKVLGIEPGEGRGRGSKGQKWGSDGSRDPQLRGSKARRAPRQLPSGVAKDADVLDVWFESKEQQKERRRR